MSRSVLIDTGLEKVPFNKLDLRECFMTLEGKLMVKTEKGAMNLITVTFEDLAEDELTIPVLVEFYVKGNK